MMNENGCHYKYGTFFERVKIGDTVVRVGSSFKSIKAGQQYVVESIEPFRLEGIKGFSILNHEQFDLVKRAKPNLFERLIDLIDGKIK